MKKVIIIIISVIVGLVILIRIPINLHRNAYYYATHMPHKSNQYPFVPLLAEHKLPSSYVPGYKSESYSSSVRDPTDRWVLKENIKQIGDSFTLTDGAAIYSLDKPFQIVSARYAIYFLNNGYIVEEKRGKISHTAKKITFNCLNNIQNEIKQNALKPKVNLQWIWNIWFKIHYR